MQNEEMEEKAIAKVPVVLTFLTMKLITIIQFL